MKIKDLTFDTAIIAPPATTTALTWAGIHVPDIIQFCMLIYAVGLAVKTVYRLWVWLRTKRATA